jgi:hypothetical protein
VGELLEGVVVVALRCVTHMNYEVYIHYHLRFSATCELVIYYYYFYCLLVQLAL